MTSNAKKLLLYSLDCVKSCGRNNIFHNLKGNKENKIILTDSAEFAADNTEIIEIMTLAALNRGGMSLLKGGLIAEGTFKRDQICSPLIYFDCELIRENDKIKLIYDSENPQINFSLISSLLENDNVIIENVINQLMEIDDPINIDFLSVLRGLIPSINNLKINKTGAIILTKTPEAIAGVLNELKQIAELY